MTNNYNITNNDTNNNKMAYNRFTKPIMCDDQIDDEGGDDY